jgi:hypothetical protein
MFLDNCKRFALVDNSGLNRFYMKLSFSTIVVEGIRLGIKRHRSSKPTFELFVADIDCKPPLFYSKRVKNLWTLKEDGVYVFERILSTCSGVENLILFSLRNSINHPFISFLELPISGSHLRRLTCKLEHLFPPWTIKQNFQYACFANFIHLHLYNDVEYWSI